MSWKQLTPVASFAVGWFGYQYADSHSLIPIRLRHNLALYSLQTQLFVVKTVPSCLLYGKSEDELRDQISFLRSVSRGDGKVAFEDILKECQPKEQVGFLEDHFQESIPFFFIGDLVYSWTRLHRDRYLEDPLPDLHHAGRQQDVYESKILCEGVWAAAVNKMIPFDICVSALAILAACSERNQRTMAKCFTAARLLDEYEAYTKSDDAQHGTVPEAERSVSLLSLLHSLDHEWKEKPSLLGRALGLVHKKKESQPPAGHQQWDQWCRMIPSMLSPETKQIVAPGTLQFIEQACFDRCRL